MSDLRAAELGRVDRALFGLLRKFSIGKGGTGT